MNAQQIIIPRKASDSFSVRRHTMPHMDNKWHCHEDMEIISVHQATGTQRIGDYTGRFLPGDVVFIGANLPHYWRTQAINQPLIMSKSDTTMLHFKADFMGSSWLELPESKGIRVLFAKAERGLLLRGDKAVEVAKRIEQMGSEKGFRRILLLLHCLQTMMESGSYQLLSSVGFRPTAVETVPDRLQAVYQYVFQHFKQTLRLEEAAAIVGLSPSSFCRFFKSNTGKTFSRFVQDVRVGHACKLLLNHQLSVKEVYYSSGFKNYTSFHEAFKMHTGKTPKAYYEQHGNDFLNRFSNKLSNQK